VNLDIQNIYNESVLDALPTSPPLLHLDDPLLEDAMSRLKTSKMGGLSEILSELALCGGPILLERLLFLMQAAVWREGCVFKDWKDALIVPVPKKDDLQFCDNWRGISLLDVVGKIFGQIIQNRLPVITEGLLPNSQCGF